MKTMLCPIQELYRLQILMKVNPAFCYEGRGGKERRPWENPFAN